MKNRFLLILIVACFFSQSIAEGASSSVKQAPIAVKKLPDIQTAAVPPVQPQPIDFAKCSSFFKIDSQKLFYLTLASLNANRFKIDEIQSKSGYITFTVAQRQFLASVVNISPQSSMLKITPCNNIYYFPIGIVQNMFKYIELNLNTPIEKLVVS